MNWTVWAAFALIVLQQWPSLAFADTLFTTDRDQTVLHEQGNGNILEASVAVVSIIPERGLQATTCGTTTQWEDIIVLEVQYDSSKCLPWLSDNVIVPLSDSRPREKEFPSLFRIYRLHTYLPTTGCKDGTRRLAVMVCIVTHVHEL